MSYIDRPTWSGDILVGALLATGAASAAGVGFFFFGLLFVEPALVFIGLPAAFFGFLFGLWCSFVALLLFGAPGTILLRWLGAEGQVAYCLLGACAGLGAALLALEKTPYSFWFYVDAVLAGGVGGIVWWRSYRRHFQDSEALSG